MSQGIGKARIVLSEFLTLDGVMQGPGSVDQDRSDGFAKGGWQAGHADDTLGNYVLYG